MLILTPDLSLWVNAMHPCCWGNMFQGLLQMVPFLALFAVAARKAWDFRTRVRVLRRHKTVDEAVKSSCCCPSMDSTKVKLSS